MDKTLYIDASSERPFLIYDGHLQELKSSQELAPAISKLGSFDVIACGEGPGSYTGLRTALALASGLSLAKGVPLITVSALYGLLPEEPGAFHAMLDARSGGVYFVTGQDGICLGVPDKKSVEEIILKEFVVSFNVKPLQARFPIGSARFIEKMPEPAEIIRRVEEKLNRGSYSLVGQAELLYLGRSL
jgi:tRNA threonylcarbamoyl adenosine modification protein YeaZ